MGDELRKYDRDPLPRPVDLDALTPRRRPDLAAQREQALTIPCPVPRCRQPVGSRCVNVTDRTELASQPAHVLRLRDAGVPLPPVERREVSGWPTRRTPASRAALTRQVARDRWGWRPCG